MKRWIVAITLWCVLVASPAHAALTLNLAESFADTEAIVAGGGSADIVVLGDSLSFRSGSYLPYLRELMQSEYGNAGLGTVSFDVAHNAGTYSGSWPHGQINGDTPPHHGLDGLWRTGNSGYGFVDVLADDGAIQYIAQPGGGSVRFYQQIGGQNVDLATISTDTSDAEVREFTFAGLAGNRRVYIHPIGDGPVTFLANRYETDAPGVRISRAANGGWGVSNFLQRDWTFDDQLVLASTDLILIPLGANDNGDYAQAEYEDLLDELLDRLGSAVPDAEVVLISAHDLDQLGQNAIVAAQEAVAARRGVGFINLYELAGDHQSLQVRGFLDDGIHYSPAGGEYVADILFNVLVPEPGTLVLMSGSAVLLLTRRRHCKT